MNILRMILARIEPYIAKRMTPLKAIFHVEVGGPRLLGG